MTMTNSADKPEVAAAYDRWAESYDTDANRTREMAAVVLRQHTLELAGRQVVEIGCGTGYNTQWLADHAASVRGLDFSEGMLRQARFRVHSRHVQFMQHDIRAAWPLEDASADLVIAMLVLEHIENIASVVAEAARSLRAGGELFICELHPMRQMLGRQAEFTNPETGIGERVQAFLHDVSEYVNAGIWSGFELVHMGECRDSGSARTTPPRLLSLHFRLRDR
jgi:malonyl-CoA O-methyltransferase